MDDDTEVDETPEGFYPQALPCWRFSLWDVAGIAMTTAGGLFSVVGQGLNLAARECAAMANYTRQNYDLRQAQKAERAERRAMGEDLRALIEGSGEEEA